MAWLYKQKGSEKWWIGWRSNGSQFRKSTKTTDKKLAEKKLREQETLAQMHSDGRLAEVFVESITGKQTAKITYKAAVDHWLGECKGATAPATYEKYAKLAEDLGKFLKATDTAPLLRDVTSDDVRAFLTKRRERNSASTTNISRIIISAFFKRAVQNGQIRDNPLVLVRTFKAGAGEKLQRQAFTIDQLRLMYSKAPNDFWRYMILGGYSTGLRLGDLVTMPWGAVDTVDGMINILTRKTKKQVKIAIAGPFLEMLRDLRPKKTKTTDPVWPEQAKEYEDQRSHSFSMEFYNLILVPSGLATPRNHKGGGKGRAAKREAIGYSFHCFRHTFVSNLKATGATSEVAKALVGHSSDEINNVYTHLPEKMLADALAQLPNITTKEDS